MTSPALPFPTHPPPPPPPPLIPLSVVSKAVSPLPNNNNLNINPLVTEPFWEILHFMNLTIYRGAAPASSHVIYRPYEPRFMSVFFFLHLCPPQQRGANVTRDEGTMISSKHGRRFSGGAGGVWL